MKVVVRPLRTHHIEEIDAIGRDEFVQSMRAVAEQAAEKLAVVARTEVRGRAKRRTGQLESAIGKFSYSSVYGVGAYVGWERKTLRRKASAFQDVNGRIRKVSTVADVGGILEYSGTRQLRHMQPAYQAKEDELADYIENEIDKLLDRAGL